MWKFPRKGDKITNMNRRNYRRELENLIAGHESAGGEKPSLLLHSCCGPCSSAVLEYLMGHFRPTLLWYNPNIYPEAEFNKRLAAQREMIEKLGLSESVELLALPYSPEDFSACAAGLENEKEGGHRCALCFRLRLEKCAALAREKNFDYFCTTLTVSRHKDAVLINDIGEELARKAGAVWLPSDFKKNDGENRAVELSERYGVYRQVYCGCEYSLYAREHYDKNGEEK